jgi:ABC-type transport system involved in multi-copper enzyme maturation permease subunit
LGWTLVAIGTVAIGYAIIRSLVPLLYPLGWIAEPIKGYFVPSGLLVIAVGLVYVAIGLGFSSDHPLVVLTRRELASYFYSPIAYLVLFGLTMIGWANHYVFIQRLLETIGPSPFGGGGRAMLEPIVGRLIIDLIPVFAVIFVVPAITMRSLSEEQRTGTLEVMLTVALSEYMIVLSKFIASFVFFMLLWVPWAMFLVSLRIEGGTDFDYRPILGFVLALAASGAGFVSMGIFFSSLTRNQIIAAVLCFMGMLAHLVCFLVANAVSNNPGDSFAASILRSLSFISIWQDSITGKVPIKDLLLHLSFCVFWLYLTVKVLEARRWR